MTQRQPTILAIDAGGSSTRCLVAGVDGSVLGFGTGGPGNHILSDWQTAKASLQDATAQALRAAGTAAASVDVAVAGSAGVGANGEGRETVESLVAELVPQVTAVRAVGDMVAALWGALRTPVGVVVAAGTGSVAFGRDARGRTCQVGGWGHLFGDEGSAYDIATRALRAMARATDGRDPPTQLTSLVATALGERTPVAAALRVYVDRLSREAIASLAVHVVAAAAAGDATATAILRGAGEELGLLAVTVLRTLALLDTAAAVSFAGSVFATAGLVYDAFVTLLHAAAPKVRVEPPLLPPLGGAFRLGVAALGIAEDGGAVERLRSALEATGT